MNREQRDRILINPMTEEDLVAINRIRENYDSSPMTKEEAWILLSFLADTQEQVDESYSKLNAAMSKEKP